MQVTCTVHIHLKWIKLMVITSSLPISLQARFSAEYFKVLCTLFPLEMHKRALTCKFRFCLVWWEFLFLQRDGNLFPHLRSEMSIWNSGSILKHSFHTTIPLLHGRLTSSSLNLDFTDSILLSWLSCDNKSMQVFKCIHKSSQWDLFIIFNKTFQLLTTGKSTMAFQAFEISSSGFYQTITRHIIMHAKILDFRKT